MKITVLSICFLLNSIFLMAQNFPVNEESGKVEIIEVVDVPGASADQLYKRAEKWFGEFYTNANSVIEEKKAGEKIFGKHKINLYADEKGNKLHKGFVNYYIEIGFKEGKYRYKLYEFYTVKGVKVFINEWIGGDAPNQDVLDSYLKQVSDFTDELLSSMKETLNKPLEEESADDW